MLLAVAMACAAPALAQEKISDGFVKIGVLTDMSSVYSESGGIGSVIAAKMAVEDYGGKVLGKPVTVITADHQNKADIGASKAREWIDVEKVDMITDVITSSVALAVAYVTHEKKRVNMTVGAGTTRLTNEECSPYTVHYAYDTYALANGTAKTVTQQGGDTWYFMTADYVFGTSLEKDAGDVVKANGGKVLGAVRHPLNTSDFSSFLMQAQASKAKIIGLANAGNDMINTLKGAREFGLAKGGQRFAGMLININDTHNMGLEVAQGMLLTEGFYWDRNDETRKFSRRYFERAKKMPNMIHAGVYSAVTNYLKAVEAAGTDNPDQVMAKLKSTKINDFYATNGVIREDGRMVHDMYLVEVKSPSESKYPWDYYRIKHTIPASEAFIPLSKSKCPLVKK
ncbi:MAG: ABC transporter substrate-binding protein [Burkholderiaceae bacterium]